jgi:hypothetical protein
MAGECASGGPVVKKVHEYLQHADECRAIAKTMIAGRHREALLELAAHWDKLAVERSDLIQRHPELTIQEQHEEELAERQARLTAV